MISKTAGDDIVAVLDTILPTYYELFVDSSTETPCITYREQDNYTEIQTDIMGYSRIS